MAFSSDLTAFSAVTENAPLSPAYLNSKFTALENNINTLNASAGAFASNLVPDTNSAHNLGSATKKMGNVYTRRLISMRTTADASGYDDREIGMLFTSSGMSWVYRSDDTLYDIGSNTSAAL